MEYREIVIMNDYILYNMCYLKMTGNLTHDTINELKYYTKEDITNIIIDFSQKFKMIILLNNLSHCQFYLIDNRLFIDIKKIH